VMDYQWDMIQRQTAFVGLVEPAGPGVISEFQHLPGVVQAQPAHRAAVELRMGSRYRRVNIQGLPTETSLFRIIDSHEREIVLPPEGLVLSEKLAEVLGVGAGDEVQVRFLEGKRTETRVRVAALAQDFAGTAAYMQLDALNRLVGEGDRLSGAYLAVADSGWAEFLATLKRTPRAGTVLIKEAIRESFRQTTAESMGLIQKMYLTFAVVVAFGIIYNSARISLSERQRELATLRVIGFTRGEVAVVLVGELVALTLLALPIGLLVGSGLTTLILQMVDNEFIRLPLILTPANYAFAILVVAVASTASALLACRRLNRLDLVGALKAPE